VLSQGFKIKVNKMYFENILFYAKVNSETFFYMIINNKYDNEYMILNKCF